MELAQLMILVGFIGTSYILFYAILAMCLKAVGVYAREFSTNLDASDVTKITKYIGKTYWGATALHGDKDNVVPVGLVIGTRMQYIAYITTSSIQKRDSVAVGYNVTFWSSDTGHTKSLSDNFVDLEKGIANDNNDNNEKQYVSGVLNTILEIWRHYGAYKSDAIEKFDILFCDEDYAEQLQIVERVKEMAQISSDNGYGYRLVTMIAGPSGTGKSHIAKRFAKAIGATFTDDFVPTRAGENFASLIKNVKPTKSKPLVVLLDEGDRTFDLIERGTLKEHEFFVTPVIDKASHNTFMDRLNEHNYVFIFITMNKTFVEIDKADPSFTRCGRIDLKVNFGGDESYKSADETCYVHVPPFKNIAIDRHKKRFTAKPKVAKATAVAVASGGNVYNKQISNDA